MPKREWDQPSDERDRFKIRLEFALLLLQILFLIGAALFWLVSPASAHPGGLASNGCHNDRKNGGRHCHRGPAAKPPKSAPSGGAIYYPNCAAARAASAAPIYRGEPGYRSHFDRDEDGKACE